MTHNNGAERRLHERHELKDRVFITNRHQIDRIGWLTDISRGGISFEYPNIQDSFALTEKIHVDIFSSPRKYDLSNLPCKLVYDTPIDHGNGFMQTIGTRRCGLVFEEISQQQAVQLDSILNKIRGRT